MPRILTSLNHHSWLDPGSEVQLCTDECSTGARAHTHTHAQFASVFQFFVWWFWLPSCAVCNSVFFDNDQPESRGCLDNFQTVSVMLPTKHHHELMPPFLHCYYKKIWREAIIIISVSSRLWHYFIISFTVALVVILIFRMVSVFRQKHRSTLDYNHNNRNNFQTNFCPPDVTLSLSLVGRQMALWRMPPPLLNLATSCPLHTEFFKGFFVFVCVFFEFARMRACVRVCSIFKRWWF